MRVESSDQASHPYRLLFQGKPELEVVRVAYIEHVYDLEKRGNPSSVATYERRLSELSYSKKAHAIHTPNPKIVTDKLYALHENTDEVTAVMLDVIGDLADASQVEMRMAGVVWRYNLGSRALALAELVDINIMEFDGHDVTDIDFEAEFAPILRPRPQSI